MTVCAIFDGRTLVECTRGVACRCRTGGNEGPRVSEIYRRIEELEYRIACKDMMRNDAEAAREELEALAVELEGYGRNFGD